MLMLSSKISYKNRINDSSKSTVIDALGVEEKR